MRAHLCAADVTIVIGVCIVAVGYSRTTPVAGVLALCRFMRAHLCAADVTIVIAGICVDAIAQGILALVALVVTVGILTVGDTVFTNIANVIVVVVVVRLLCLQHIKTDLALLPVMRIGHKPVAAVCGYALAQNLVADVAMMVAACVLAVIIIRTADVTLVIVGIIAVIDLHTAIITHMVVIPISAITHDCIADIAIVIAVGIHAVGQTVFANVTVVIVVTVMVYFLLLQHIQADLALLPVMLVGYEPVAAVCRHTFTQHLAANVTQVIHIHGVTALANGFTAVCACMRIRRFYVLTVKLAAKVTFMVKILVKASIDRLAAVRAIVCAFIRLHVISHPCTADVAGMVKIRIQTAVRSARVAGTVTVTVGAIAQPLITNITEMIVIFVRTRSRGRPALVASMIVPVKALAQDHLTGIASVIAVVHFIKARGQDLVTKVTSVIIVKVITRAQRRVTNVTTVILILIAALTQRDQADVAKMVAIIVNALGQGRGANVTVMVAIGVLAIAQRVATGIAKMIVISIEAFGHSLSAPVAIMRTLDSHVVLDNLTAVFLVAGVISVFVNVRVLRGIFNIGVQNGGAVAIKIAVYWCAADHREGLCAERLTPRAVRRTSTKQERDLTACKLRSRFRLGAACNVLALDTAVCRIGKIEAIVNRSGAFKANNATGGSGSLRGNDTRAVAALDISRRASVRAVIFVRANDTANAHTVGGGDISGVIAVPNAAAVLPHDTACVSPRSGCSHLGGVIAIQNERTCLCRTCNSACTQFRTDRTRVVAMCNITPDVDTDNTADTVVSEDRTGVIAVADIAAVDSDYTANTCIRTNDGGCIVAFRDRAARLVVSNDACGIVATADIGIDKTKVLHGCGRTNASKEAGATAHIVEIQSADDMVLTVKRSVVIPNRRPYAQNAQIAHDLVALLHDRIAVRIGRENVALVEVDIVGQYHIDLGIYTHLLRQPEQVSRLGKEVGAVFVGRGYFVSASADAADTVRVKASVHGVCGDRQRAHGSVAIVIVPADVIAVGIKDLDGLRTNVERASLIGIFNQREEGDFCDVSLGKTDHRKGRLGRNRSVLLDLDVVSLDFKGCVVDRIASREHHLMRGINQLPLLVTCIHIQCDIAGMGIVDGVARLMKIHIVRVGHIHAVDLSRQSCVMRLAVIDGILRQNQRDRAAIGVANAADAADRQSLLVHRQRVRVVPLLLRVVTAIKCTTAIVRFGTGSPNALHEVRFSVGHGNLAVLRDVLRRSILDNDRAKENVITADRQSLRHANEIFVVFTQIVIRQAHLIRIGVIVQTGVYRIALLQDLVKDGDRDPDLVDRHLDRIGGAQIIAAYIVKPIGIRQHANLVFARNGGQARRVRGIANLTVFVGEATADVTSTQCNRGIELLRDLVGDAHVGDEIKFDLAHACIYLCGTRKDREAAENTAAAGIVAISHDRNVMRARLRFL